METASIMGHLKIDALLKVAAQVVADDVPGAVAEVGVYKGGVLRELSRTFPDRTVYGYDTFAGMPAEHWQEGEAVLPGSFDSTLVEVREVVDDCPNVVLRPGLFPATGDDVEFAFVHLDVDMYLSTRHALEWLLPRMALGGVIVLDDWDWPECPGVRRAVEDLGLIATPTDCVFQAALHF
jgi:O-methyltransferase